MHNTIKQILGIGLLCTCILPAAAQNTLQAAGQLRSYFQAQTDLAKETIDVEAYTDTVSGRYDLKDITTSHPEDDSISETARDIKSYITDVAEYAMTGNVNNWERKRILLYNYVQKSNWMTFKNISEADHAFIKLIKTLAGGAFEYVCQSLGWDLLGDRIRQKAINEFESNEQVQWVAKAASNDIADMMDGDDHTADALYIKIQHNAFELLSLNYVDFCKVVKAYPEVGFLFDDLYTFFKWRYDLRTYDLSYKENENNINLAIRRSAGTNSFLAWWELANVAKDSIRQSIEQEQHKASTMSSTTERDNMEVYEAYAKRSLYFGRLWNGIQRYAVKERQALEKHMNPKRGAFKAKLKNAINKDMANFSNEQVLTVLTDVRARYVNARIDTESAWATWVREHASEIKKQREIMRQRYEERNPEQSVSSDEVIEVVEQEQVNPDDQQVQEGEEPVTQEQLQEEVNQVTQQQIEEEVASALKGLGWDLKKIQTRQGEQFKRSLKRRLAKENLI